VASHQLERPGGRGSGQDRKAFRAGRLEHRQVLGLVVDEKNMASHDAASIKALSASCAGSFCTSRGMRSTNSVPEPTWLDTAMLPPSTVTTRRTIVSPIPIPRPT